MNVRFSQLIQQNWFECVIGLTVLVFLFPIPYHTVPSLDSSWQVVLEEAFFNKWQFGKDFIFTGGPLNFLYARTSIGYYPKLQVLLEALILLWAILYILYATKQIRNWARILLAMGMIAGAASTPDTLFLLSIAAAAISVLRSRFTVRSTLFFGFYCALLTLVKFTFGVLGITCTAIVVANYLLYKQQQAALICVASYLLPLCLIWALVGQSIFNLPAYFAHSLSLSSGYTNSMQLNAHPTHLIASVLMIWISSIPMVLWLAGKKSEITHFSILILGLLVYFLTWKAGFTRAGAHLAIIFQTASFLPFLILPVIGGRKSTYIWVSSTLVLGVVAYFWLLPDRRALYYRHASSQLKFGWQFITTGGSNLSDFTNVIPNNKNNHKLQKIGELIGNRTVDILRFHNGILLLNDFNYKIRPSIQNYHGLNDHMARWNLRHMESNPPDFILACEGRVDSRYPTTDDNLFIWKVLENYEPVIEEKDYLLLERVERFSQSLSKPVLERRVNVGEKVDIRTFANKPLWMKSSYAPSIFQQIVAFFFKPEMVHINIETANGESRLFRLLPANMENGFLLNPLLEINSEIQKFLGDRELTTRIVSFSLHTKYGNKLFRTKEFDIQLSQLLRNTPSS